MILLQPLWLAFIVPLGALAFWAFRRRLPLFWLRLALLLVMLVLLAGPRRLLPNQEGTLVVVCDRSASMPADSDARQNEWLRQIHAQRPSRRTRLALVGFDNQAFAEGFADAQPPTFSAPPGAEGSNLEAALHLAGNLIDEKGAGRVLVMSDGFWTGKDPNAAAQRLAGRGIAVDVFHQGMTQSDSVAIQRVEAPNSLGPGEGFLVHAWLKAAHPQKVLFRLERGQELVAAGERSLRAGTNRLLLRDLAPESGNHAYRLTITPTQSDARPENNQADFLLAVAAPKPLLHLTYAPQGTLAQSLRASGLTVDSVDPKYYEPSLGKLSGYAAVIIDDVLANDLGDPFAALLAAWIRDAGGGLLMLGGKNTFGIGGYYQSPLDPVLPVSMELRKEQRKHQMAMVVTLDRSGSMSAAADAGRTKMDLANLASAEVVKLLSPMDLYGHYAVDSEAHLVLNLQPVKNKNHMAQRIRAVESGGGGIFVYEALEKAARMIQTADRDIRHIILFADAADAEAPGAYRELLEKLRAAKITVSVVALGTDQDSDAELLKEIATLGNGRVYFTHDAGSLPRIFAQDTFVVARSSFVEEATSTRFTPLMQGLSTFQWSAAPQLGGYNLVYPRDEAQSGLLSEDDNKAPLLAWWYAGSGRVMTFTGQAAGPYSGGLAQWRDYGTFFASLARWVGGSGQTLPGNSVATSTWHNGLLTTRLHLDPQRKRDPFSVRPRLHLLHERSGSEPKRETLRFQWESPHELVVQQTIHSEETVLPTVDFGDDRSWRLAPVTLPYSPEYTPDDSLKGARTLTDLAMHSAGRERLSPSGIWDEVPLGEGYRDLRPYWLMAALLLLLLEVAERRLALTARLPRRRAAISAHDHNTTAEADTVTTKTPRHQEKRRSASEAAAPTVNHQAPSANPAPAPANLADVLSKAKQVADKRTKR